MPIIALTAVEDNDIRENASKAGISDYLQKPTSEENVRDILIRFFPKT
jgi:FixJ family two-component response regulator